MKFKVGDKVRLTGRKSNGSHTFIEMAKLSPKMKKGSVHKIDNISRGSITIDNWYFNEIDFGGKRMKNKNPTHIIQYDLVEELDPFELVYSDKECKERVIELAKDTNVVEKSIQVHKIAKTTKPKITIDIQL